MTEGKIGVLIDFLHAGGVEKIALSEVKALKEIGTEAYLVVLRESDFKDHPFMDLLENIPIIFLDQRLPRILRLSFKFPFFSFFSFYHLSYPLLLPWVVKPAEFKAFLSHGTYTTFTAITLSWFRKIPFAVMVWDPIYYILQKAYPSGILKKLQFLILPLGKLADYLVVSKASVVLVAGSAHVPYLKKLGVKRIDKLYPAVDPVKELPEKRSSDIVMVTAWKEGKNPDYNLELLKKLPAAKLIMAGNWYPANLEEEFKEKIRLLGMESRVVITGSLTEKQLRDYYLSARVFVQTNDDRGFGMGALEAASCGCPFIIPLHQGVGELFEEGQHGYFTKERDTEKILEKLSLFLNDEKRSLSMGKKAWEKVINNYSWEKHALTLVGELAKL